MTTIQTDTLISQRAETYKLLSFMYKEPKEDLSVYSQLLWEELRNTDVVAVACEKMNSLFSDDSQNIDDYKVEYAKLFVGPFKLFAPPYSSIYLEDKWEVMGRSTQSVESFYKRAGLSVETANSEPADHISLQFEFMYYLNFKLIETGDLFYLELQKEFLYKILTHWIPKFNASIQENAALEFYKYLGDITEKFIQLDYSSL